MMQMQSVSDPGSSRYSAHKTQGSVPIVTTELAFVSLSQKYFGKN